VQAPPPKPQTVPTPNESYRLIININQTDDEESDRTRLHNIMDVMKDFPGEDEVYLRINNGEKVTSLKLPQVTIKCCADLSKKLADVVGEGNVRVETYNRKQNNNHYS
jgi:DNA polymerase-3 subunit alpha